MIVEDGTGIANADTYVDPAGAFAVDYIANHLYASAWTAATPEQRQAAVIMATRLIDSGMDWQGRTQSFDQSLAWPRYEVRANGYTVTGLPKKLQGAVLETALALLERNRISDTTTGTAPVEKIGLGDGALELTFGADPTAAQAPPATMIPPYALSLLRDYGWSSGGGMKRIERQ